MPARRATETDGGFIARLIDMIEHRDATIEEQAARIRELEKPMPASDIDKQNLVALLSQFDETGTGLIPWKSVATVVSKLGGDDVQPIEDDAGLVDEDGNVSIVNFIDWMYGESMRRFFFFNGFKNIQNL